MSKILDNRTGILGTEFQIGGAAGQQIVTDSAKLKATLADGTTLTEFEFKQGTALGDGATVKNVRERNVLVEYGVDATSYSIGTNTGKYGVVSVAGTLDSIAFTIGQIILDGATGAVEKITPYVGLSLTMKSGVSVSGTGLSLVANGVYSAEAATTPYSWTLKGDGTTAVTTGIEKQIKVPITTAASTSSTTTIPDGALVTSVETVVTTAYSATAAIVTTVVGSSPITLQTVPTADAAVTATGNGNSFVDYINQAVGATGTGVVNVAISNTPGAGAGYVIVKYVETFLG
jgi:hypothetical protein